MKHFTLIEFKGMLEYIIYYTRQTLEKEHYRKSIVEWREGVTTPSSPLPFSFLLPPQFSRLHHRSIRVRVSMSSGCFLVACGWPVVAHEICEGVLGFCYSIFVVFK
jgi:hypothetical protein